MCVADYGHCRIGIFLVFRQPAQCFEFSGKVRRILKNVAQIVFVSLHNGIFVAPEGQKLDMRDPDLLISMLKEMANEEAGQILIVKTFDSDVKREHHADLLVDAGHAEWQSEQALRITNDGYDFLNAVYKQPMAMEAFLKCLNQGATYMSAAGKAVDFVQNLIG